MPIIKCKMCGGDLRIEEGSTVCECEYCGTRQTVPSVDNEKKLTLFSRAGRLLRGCEFDKAAGVFEAIVADFPEEAEAYWGLVLCKYGIEYVDDPATGKKIPTCHRSSFESVLDDPNFEQACENTDALARRVYRDEARQIEDLRKQIIEVSGKEEPYDIFISYKETDEHGDRTLDSVIAQDIYTELIEKGYRVFFSRISLEDKLGTEYEPYIFAALNSAKVMLVVGTDYENFDSVWVKNEWSRFLKLIASGQKKTLIPVFKNMDAYDMPKEFAKLAAQDMGKVGAMQDLVRGVEKLVRKKTAPVPAQQPQQVIVQQSGGPNTVALLKRGQQALEDCNWDKAREFFDRVLDIDAENSDAFFGLFLAGARCINEENYINKVSTKNSQTEMLKLSPVTERIEKIVKQYRVKDYLPENELRAMFQYDLGYPSCVKAKQNLAANEKQVFERDRNLARAIRYSKNEETARAIRFKARLFAELDAGIKKAKDQEIEDREAKQKSYEAFLAAAEKKAEFKYQQALERLEENRRKQEEARQRELAEKEAARRKELAEQEAARKKAEEELERKYQTAIRKYDQAKNPAEYQKVKDSFLSLQSYKDSAAMAVQCDEMIAAIKKAEAEEEERQRLLRERAERAKQAKKRRITVTLIALAGIAAAVFFAYTKLIVPGNLYKSAEALFESGKYEEAVAAFESLNGFKDSAVRIEEVKAAILDRDYAAAEAIFESGDYDNAISAFEALNGYRDSTAKITEAKEAINAREYAVAEELLVDKKYAEALSVFKALGDYKDSSARAEEIQEIIREKTSDVASWNKNSFIGHMSPSTIAAGGSHTVGLKSDGTVLATGSNKYGQCDISEWNDIVAIAAGENHTVGLKSDGTVQAVGSNKHGQCDTSEWDDIVAIAAGDFHTVGLKSDGTVIAAGNGNYGRCNVTAWRGIIALSAGRTHTVGLMSDGTVVAVGSNKFDQCDVSDWRDIVAITAGDFSTVGFKSDGTVVTVGSNNYGSCDVSDWHDIVEIAAGEDRIVGLKSDGTVVANGSNYYGSCNVSGWSNIVEIAVGNLHTIGLKSDGTVVATGDWSSGQCKVSGWTDIKLPDAPETQVASSVTEPKSPFRIKPSLGVDVKKGTLTSVYLEKVSPDGPAAKAGVKENDLVMSFNSKKIVTTQDFLDLYEQCSDGETIILELYPGGESHTVTVSLGTPKKLGIGALGTNSEGVGVVASKVVPYSSAEKAGIQAGDMIFAIDEQRVLNIETYNMILDQYEVGDTVNVTIVRGNDELSADVTLEESGLAIFEDLPQSIDVEAGTSGALLSIRVAGNVDKNSIVWKGSYIIESNEDGSWIESTNVYTADSNVNTRGIRVDTQYDNDTDTYVSTLWADGISSEAAGNYYCRVEDGNGLTIQSSTVEVCVK